MQIDRLSALQRAPALLLFSLLFGLATLWLLAHSGLSSFGPVPGPASRLAGTAALAQAHPLLPAPAPAAPKPGTSTGWVTARPPLLLGQRGSAAASAGTDAGFAAAPPLTAAPAAAGRSPLRAADPPAGGSADTWQFSLPLDALFLPGETTFSEEGSALLRQNVLAWLGSEPGADRITAMQVRLAFPDDQPSPTPGVVRRYQERTVRLLRQFGVVARTARIEFAQALSAPTVGLPSAGDSAPGMASAEAADAVAADDPAGDDEDDLADVPHLTLVLQRG